MAYRMWAVFLAALLLWGCEDETKASVEKAKQDVAFLADIAAQDLQEVRSGLPQGGKLFGPLYAEGKDVSEDLPAVRDALEETRRQVQDLRVAKSTFFALVSPEGKVLRNDQEQDRMAGKDLFGSFPEVKKAVSTKQYTEAFGSMKEAAGVAEPRPDGQWLAAQPIVLEGDVRGLYVTGWSWTSYAYRLEFALRGKIRSELMAKEGEGANEPLVYVFVIVDRAVYAAPVTPEVSIEAVQKLDLLDKLQNQPEYAQALEITGRGYGLAARKVPSYRGNVALAVLRSET